MINLYETSYIAWLKKNMLAYPFCNQTNLPLGLLILSASGRDIAVAMPSTLEVRVRHYLY